MSLHRCSSGSGGGGGMTYVEDDFNGTGTTLTYNVTDGMFGYNNDYYGGGGYIIIHEGSIVKNTFAPTAVSSASYSGGVLTLTRGSQVSTAKIYGYYS